MIGQIVQLGRYFRFKLKTASCSITYIMCISKKRRDRYVLRSSTCSPTYKKSLLLSFCLHTYIHLVTLYLQELSHFDNYPYDASGQFLRVFYAFLSLAQASLAKPIAQPMQYYILHIMFAESERNSRGSKKEPYNTNTFTSSQATMG